MRKRLVNLGLLVVIIAASIFLYKRYYQAHDIELNAITIEGNQPLADFIHPPTIVHFYASWCGPCMRELPEIIAYATNTNTPYELVLITDDSQEKIDALKENMPGQYSIYRVNSLKENNIYTIPVTYFVDENSVIIKKQLGECAWNDAAFTSSIEELVK